MIKRAAIALSVTLLSVNSATATEFRCYPSDLTAFFKVALGTTAEYQIVLGKFSFDPGQMPQSRGSLLLPQVVPIPAKFVGHILGINGELTDAAFDLTILPGCIMVTCTAMQPEENVLAFVRITDSGPVLDADPCLTPAFTPLPETIALLSACLGQNRCKQDQFLSAEALE